MLTIIVTAYNIEKYIDKCLQTVCRQTYQDIEVIIVDDGSTDSTLSICKEYEQRDSRVKVLHQDNQGIICARKRGTLSANGDYITFVDGDDWLEPETYDRVIGYVAEDVDLVTSGMYIDHEDNSYSIFDYFPEGIYDSERLDKEIIPQMAWVENTRSQGISSSVCNKLFKKDPLLSVLNSIDERISDGEDAAIVYPYLLRSKKVYVSNKLGYHYVQRKGSMLHNCSIETFGRIQLLRDQLRRTMVFKGNILEKQIKGYLSYHILPVLEVLYGIRFFDLAKTFKLPPIQFYYNKRVIIYGAGEKGNYYVDTIKSIENTEVVLWVDKKVASIGDLRIEHPKHICSINYDYILVAIEDRDVCNSVKLELIAQGIPAEKIIF